MDLGSELLMACRAGVGVCVSFSAIEGLPQVNQWIDVSTRPDVSRMEILDRLSAALVDVTFLAGHRITVVDYLLYFLVHPLVVRGVWSCLRPRL
jgi:hypothetical protein